MHTSASHSQEDEAEESPQAEGLIQVMPEALANKIAAGEVVERPASAAKELVENALDAGAEEVMLLIKDAGRTLVQVVDDGCGMSRADAERCFQRHATSKIRSIEDLERVRTLGFRGEALASIAAVAQVELKTKRTEDAAGWRIRIEGGTRTAAAPCAAPDGTSVAVHNLFYNVPARRNFLRTQATEFKHLVDTFRFLALAEPRTAFALIHNENEVYRLTPARAETFSEALRHRIRELFGDACAKALVALHDESSYLTVRGFVSRPEYHRRGRDEQFLFVNGRHVESRYLAHAVRAAYADALPEGTFPFFALFLELDPHHIDVNVHPTKAEVKFDDQSGVYGFLRSATHRALGAESLTPQLDSPVEDEDAPPAFRGKTVPMQPLKREGKAPPARPAVPRKEERDVPLGHSPSEYADALYAPRIPPGEAAVGTAQETADDEEEELFVQQLRGRYVVTIRAGGVLVVDQQGAHRRVLYEKALRHLEGTAGETQQLLFPHTLELSAPDFALVEELLPELHALGFEVETFGGRSIVVRGVPPELRVGEERAGLEVLLQQYKENRDRLHLDKRESLARSLAIRSAIRAGQSLRPAEMRALIDALFRCEMPYVDPQGRPTTVALSVEDLDERFGR